MGVGGYVPIVITGNGFSLETSVTVCEKECTVTSVTPEKTSLECTIEALDVFRKTTCIVNVTNIDDSTGDGISRLSQERSKMIFETKYKIGQSIVLT